MDTDATYRRTLPESKRPYSFSTEKSYINHKQSAIAAGFSSEYDNDQTNGFLERLHLYYSDNEKKDERKLTDVDEMSRRLRSLEDSEKWQKETIKKLEKHVEDLTSALQRFLDSELSEVVNLSEEETRKIVLDEISQCGNEAIYPSDIALKHNLNIDDVERIMDCLVADGVLR